MLFFFKISFHLDRHSSKTESPCPAGTFLQYVCVFDVSKKIEPYSVIFYFTFALSLSENRSTQS